MRTSMTTRTASKSIRACCATRGTWAYRATTAASSSAISTSSRCDDQRVHGCRWILFLPLSLGFLPSLPPGVGFFGLLGGFVQTHQTLQRIDQALLARKGRDFIFS